MKKIFFLYFLFSLSFSMVKYVQDINISGNYSISNSQILQNTRIKKPFLFYKSTFTPKSFNIDLLSIQSLYKNKGYLNCRVEGDFLYDSTQLVNINIVIDEGPLFYLRNLEIIVDDSLSSIYNKKIALKKNKTYSRKKLQDSIKYIKNKFYNRGYINIDIQYEEIFVENDVFLILKIFTGDRYKINLITYEGYEHLEMYKIERELQYSAGDYYNQKKINNSEKRIFDSNMFSMVNTEISNINHIEKKVDINIKVREISKGSFGFDFGFGRTPTESSFVKESSITTNFNWSANNIFNGYGTIKFNSDFDFYIVENNFDIDRQFYVLDYSIPWIFKVRTPLHLSGYYEVFEDRQFYGLNLRLTQIKKKNYLFQTNLNIEYFNSNYDISDEDSRPERSLHFLLIKKNVNNYVYPSRGYHLQIEPKLFGSFLGGNSNFIKLDFIYKNYKQLPRQTVLANRLIFGFNKPFLYNDIATQIPFYEKYYLGGSSTLRGWHSAIDNEKNVLFLINTELRFPINGKFGGQLFIDYGKLSDTIFNLSTTQGYGDFGIGINYKTIFGPIRGDIAVNDKNETNYLFSLLFMF